MDSVFLCGISKNNVVRFARNNEESVPVKDIKYRTLVETLKKNILDGKYDVRNPFPSMRALICRFKLSKTTVQHALDDLAHQGLISRKQGRGTFVSGVGSSRKIGLMLSGLTYSEYFQPIATAIMKLARDAGYEPCFGAVQSRDSAERLHDAREICAEFIRNRVAGVIYHPLDYAFDSGETNRQILSVFKKARIPVVLFDSDVEVAPNRSEYDIVSIDNALAGERMACHMMDNGARNIHFLLKPNWMPNALLRVRGVMNAVTGKGLPWSHKNVFIADPHDVDLVRKLFRRRPRPDAVICENDTLAAEFMKSLSKIGLKVPDDVMLAGFDDVNIARLLSPSLTSIHQPCEQIARAAFKRLRERIADPGQPYLSQFIPATLAARQSTVCKRK